MSNSSHKPADIEYLFFEFTTSAPTAKVKKCFENLTIMYSFKVNGAGRYLFLVKNDQSEGLKRLTLPEDAQKDVITFPMMTLDHFYNVLQIDVIVEEEAAIPSPADKDLTFVERIWDPKALQHTTSKFIQSKSEPVPESPLKPAVSSHHRATH